MKALYGGTDQDGRLGANENSRPASSEPLPSLLSKADLDYQIDAGLRDAMDMNGSRSESFPSMQKGQDTESFSPRDLVSKISCAVNTCLIFSLSRQDQYILNFGPAQVTELQRCQYLE